MTDKNNEIKIARDPDIEEISNRLFIHPISDWLALKLAPKNIHPNWVSFAGLLCGIVASFCYFLTPSSQAIVWGFIFMIAWHIFDGADGHLARLTGKASAIGKIIDGIADYSVFGAVYISLTMLSYQKLGISAVYLLVGAIISHILQSATYERQREVYRLWVYDQKKDKETKTDNKETAKGTLAKIASYMNNAYLFVQNILTQHDMAHKHLESFQALPKNKKEKARLEYKQRFAPQIRLWTLMSANLHTLALFLFTFFGQSWSYFLFEIIGLNLLLSALIFHQRQMNNNFLRWLDNETK